jgi:hypothetical protein
MEHKRDIFSLTLTELVTAVAGTVSEVRRDLVERRLANWIARGVLKPIDEFNPGSGRYRRFTSETAYVSAVLLRLPLMSIAEVKAVADVLGIELRRGGELTGLWAAAKDRHEARQHRTIFISVNVRLDDAGEKPLAVLIDIKQGNGLTSPPFYIQGLSAIVINLTDAFAGVRLP